MKAKVIVSFLCLISLSAGAQVTGITSFSPNSLISAGDMNDNFSILETYINGSLCRLDGTNCNAGTGANQLVKLDASGFLPGVDGSALTNLNPANLSGAVPVSKGGTGVTSFTGSRVLYSTAGGAGVSELNCSAGQVVGYSGSTPTCVNLPAPVWTNDGGINYMNNVGIGANSQAQSTLYVEGNPMFTGSLLRGNSTFGSSGMLLDLFDNGTNRFTVKVDGRVGIGTPSPEHQLVVEKNVFGIEPLLVIKNSVSPATDYGAGLLYKIGPGSGVDMAYIESKVETGTDSNLSFHTATTGTLSEKMVITSGGTVGIGTANPDTLSYKLEVVGDILIDGVPHSTGGTTFTAPSDKRLKKDISPFGMGLEALLKIRRPINFKYNGLGKTKDNGKEYVGIIAQELREIAPFMVSTRKVKLRPSDKKEEETLSVDSSAFTYMLINSVKELHQKLSSLELKRNIANADVTEEKFKAMEEENKMLKAYLCQKDKEAPFCK